MNGSNKTATEYAKWFDGLIKSFVDRDRQEWQPEENYLQCNALFITFTFDGRRIRRRQSALNDSSGTIVDPDYRNVDRLNKDGLSAEFFNVDRLYKKGCKHLLGGRYAKRKDQQPLMIAALDVNGTRFGRPDRIENPHVHSIWVFRRGQIDRFRAFLDEVISGSRYNEFDFDAIHVEEVGRMDVGAKAPTRLSSYTAKFLGLNSIDPVIGQDLAIYPKL